MKLLPRRRQERAFERVYRRHAGDVYRYALAVLRDPEDAEDVTYTTFLNAYRGFRGGRRAQLRLNALLAIAHEVCRLHGGHARLDEADLLADEEEVTTAADIRRALGRLPFEHRAVLVMREVEGRSYAEIAEILALSVAQIETLIFEARHALRVELDGSLTCHQAELAISRKLDRRLSRREKRLLRRHLGSCLDCEAFARDQQAQRLALRALVAIPLPETLQSFFGSARARIPMRVAARLTVLAGTTALVVALASSGGIPNLARFIGQEQEPGADAAVVD
jgi:RNA polymerase sigma-70 factor (ECF subfamily)